MSRPLKYDTGPVVSISVEGRGAAWCNGIFAGDREICDMARRAARMGLTYYFRRCEVTADATTPLGALAAMASWSPGRTEIDQGPDDVLQFLAAGITHV
jgi:hypothetical protein